MSGVTSLNTKTGAVNVTSGNPLIGVGSSGNNVVVTATNTGITSLGVTAQTPLTSGAISLVAGSGVTLASDSLANTITISSTASGGGTSIANANGNTVACVTNGINITTPANAGDGTVIINAKSATKGNVVVETGGNGDFGVNAGVANAGLVLMNADTQILMGANALGQPVSGGTNFPVGTAGVISLQTSDANGSQLTVGGTPTPSGLYVGPSALRYNGGSVGNWKYNGNWVSGNSYLLNDLVFSVNIPQNTYVALANINNSTTDPSQDGRWRLFSVNGATANASSIGNGGGTVSVNTNGDITASPPQTGIFLIQGPQWSGNNFTFRPGSWSWDCGTYPTNTYFSGGGGAFVVQNAPGGGITFLTPATSAGSGGSFQVSANSVNIAGTGGVALLGGDGPNTPGYAGGGRLTIGATPSAVGLYINNASMTYNNQPVLTQPAINGLMRFIGAWVSGTPYVVGNVVTSASITYVCIINVTGTDAPAVDTTNWTRLA